jgi:hypothetical protein
MQPHAVADRMQRDLRALLLHQGFAERELALEFGRGARGEQLDYVLVAFVRTQRVAMHAGEQTDWPARRILQLDREKAGSGEAFAQQAGLGEQTW